MPEQNFDFRNSNNDFTQGSKLIDYKNAHIQNQNNIFNSYKTFKPLVNHKKEINIRKQILDNQNMIFYIFALFIFSIGILKFFDLKILGYKLDEEMFIYLSIFIIYILISFFVFLIITSKGYLKIEENSICINFKKYKKEIEYENVRSILKQKTIVGYAIFICKIDELEPYIQFNVNSIHVALAIEELIISKISETKSKVIDNLN